MACNCGSKKVEFQAKYKDGTTENFPTQLAASGAVRKAGGGTVRAVAKAKS